MAAAPVSGTVRSAAEGQGRAAGAGWPVSTTASEWFVVPWQELPIPRSSGALATTTDATSAATGVKALAAVTGEASAPAGAVVAGEQQRSTATSISAQPRGTGRAKQPRRPSVRPLTLVIAAIVDGV